MGTNNRKCWKQCSVYKTTCCRKDKQSNHVIELVHIRTSCKFSTSNSLAYLFQSIDQKLYWLELAKQYFFFAYYLLMFLYTCILFNLKVRSAPRKLTVGSSRSLELFFKDQTWFRQHEIKIKINLLCAISRSPDTFRLITQYRRFSLFLYSFKRTITCLYAIFAIRAFH